MMGDDEILAERRRLGGRIREMRTECHLTQDELARELFVDRSQVSRIEMGKRPVTFDQLVVICDLFSRPLSDLVLGIPFDSSFKRPTLDELADQAASKPYPAQEMADPRGWGHWSIGPNGWELMIG